MSFEDTICLLSKMVLFFKSNFPEPIRDKTPQEPQKLQSSAVFVYLLLERVQMWKRICYWSQRRPFTQSIGAVQNTDRMKNIL